MNKFGYIPTRFVLAVIFIIFMLAVFSCTPIRKSPPVEMPESFTVTGETEAPDRWWESFNDPELNTLVDQAMIGNLGLLAAWDRLDQANAAARMAGAGLWPQVRAEFGVSDSKLMGEEPPEPVVPETPDISAPPSTIVAPAKAATATTTASSASGGMGGATITDATTYSLSFTASYELDLWGRVRSARSAARLDLSATREDLSAMAMTLSGEITRTWYELIEQIMQQQLLGEQVKINKSYLELLELRFSYGRASAAEVLQQRQQVDTKKGEMPIVEMRLEMLEHQLAVLLGKTPNAPIGATGNALPELPPLPETGLPADLLLRRPDVRSAQLRLEAADYRVREAIANRFPTLSIAVSASDSEEEFRSLFDNWIRNISINLAAPLFEAGRRKREVERTQAVASERLHNFGEVVLKALKEVEDALAQERYQTEYVASLENQIELAKETVKFTLERYRNGGTDYLPVLNSLQTQQTLERQSLEAKRMLITYRINLYRALGGSWDLPKRATDENNETMEEGNSQ